MRQPVALPGLPVLHRCLGRLGRKFLKKAIGTEETVVTMRVLSVAGIAVSLDVGNVLGIQIDIVMRGRWITTCTVMARVMTTERVILKVSNNTTFRGTVTEAIKHSQVAGLTRGYNSKQRYKDLIETRPTIVDMEPPDPGSLTDTGTRATLHVAAMKVTGVRVVMLPFNDGSRCHECGKTGQ